MDQFRGYIISINAYKDSSLMVNLLTRETLISFEVKGKNKIQEYRNRLFSFGDFLLYKGPTKYYKLKEDNIISPLYYENLAIDKLLTLDLISEITLKVLQYERSIDEIYNLLSFTIDNLKEIDYKNLILYYIFNMLKIVGANVENDDKFIDADYKIDKSFLLSTISKESFAYLLQIFNRILFETCEISLKSIENFIN